MGGLRKYRLGLMLALNLGVQATGATAQTADPLYPFATCTGRLSALVEHQWMMSDPGSDASAAVRDSLSALTEAVLAEGQRRQAMEWRLNAKIAAAGLLNRATFVSDSVQAARASQRAAAMIEACRALVLAPNGA